MAGSALSRRVSEFVGRGAVRAGADLARSRWPATAPTDPVWFFNTGSDTARRRTSPAASARSSPSCRSSCSATRAYLIPLVLVVIGWHYFWCRRVDAAYTKLIGAALLFGCISVVPVAGVRQRSTSSGKAFRAGGYVGDGSGGVPGRLPEPHRLDHPDPDAALPVDHPLDAVLVRPAVRRSSAGWCATAGRRCSARIRARREERRREKQRQEVMKKHLDKAAGEGRRPQDRGDRTPATAPVAGAPPAEGRRPTRAREAAPEDAPTKPSRTAAMVGAAAAALKAASSQADAAAGDQAAGADAVEPPLPLPEPDEGAGRAQQGRLHAAAARAARRAEGRAQDRRARADGRRAAARREVPRVLGRRLGRPDPSRARSSRPSSSSRTPA